MTKPNYSVLFASFNVDSIVSFKKNIEHENSDYATYQIMPASRREKFEEELKKPYDMILIDTAFCSDLKDLWEKHIALSPAKNTAVFILNLQMKDAEPLIQLGYADVIPGPVDYGMLFAKMKALTGKSLVKSVPSFQAKTKATMITSPILKIQAITDQDVTFLSSVPTNIGSLSRLHSKDFTWVEGSVLGKVVDCRKVEAGYETRVCFLNLDLDTMRNLRKWIMKEYSANK